jgi:hypothetical protein
VKKVHVTPKTTAEIKKKKDYYRIKTSPMQIRSESHFVTKATHARKCIKYLILHHIVLPLHASATPVAMFEEMRFAGWIYLDITDVSINQSTDVKH